MFDPVKCYKVWPVELMELEPCEALSAAEMVSELAVVVKAADYDAVVNRLRIAHAATARQSGYTGCACEMCAQPVVMR